jgi:hypothetical protein
MIAGAQACNPNSSGIGGEDPGTPVDPSDTGTTAASSTGTTGMPPGSSTAVADTTAGTSTGEGPSTEDSTTASVDTADTETPPTVLERCNDQDLAIPDDDLTGVASSIDITEEGTIVELRVAIQATHPWVGDLAFELRKGDAALMVIDRPMECNGDDIDVVLHDDALATIDDSCLNDGRGTPALGGELLPESPLAPVFGGQSLAGTWRLRAIDADSLFVGALTRWCLQITHR